jgi:Rad3-related DNA helicase
MTDNRTSEACLALDATVLEAIKRRRSAGESLGVLAREMGLFWQRLWGILNRPAAGEALPVLRPSLKAGPLAERYRPPRLDGLWGQGQVVRVLRKCAAAPYPAAFVFEGETGTGKTSAALALASEVGCDLSQKPTEFGGLHVIASGEQTANTVRETARLM